MGNRKIGEGKGRYGSRVRLHGSAFGERWRLAYALGPQLETRLERGLE